MPSYEAELHLTLRDGTPVTLRPVSPEDRQRLQEGLQQLSPASRYSRFLSSFNTLSERQLEYLTSVDQQNHVAWGAQVDSDEPVGIGVGRFARMPEDPGTAEVAVTVLDEYQKRGLGGVLLALLYRRALQLDISGFRAYIMMSNQELVRNLQALGGKIDHHEDGAVELIVPVVPPEDLPDTEQGRRLRQRLAEIDQQLLEQEIRGGV